LKDKKPVGVLKFHSKPITSVEWNANDSTVFAASSEDNKLTLWDLAVEKDDKDMLTSNDPNNNEMSVDADESEKVMDEMLKDIPPQLLFIHEGQKEMKELHWHAQIPGVILSTAHSGFNVFKTISV
jgi:ribosome assembly protein RRB1